MGYNHRVTEKFVLKPLIILLNGRLLIETSQRSIISDAENVVHTISIHLSGGAKLSALIFRPTFMT